MEEGWQVVHASHHQYCSPRSLILIFLVCFYFCWDSLPSLRFYTNQSNWELQYCSLSVTSTHDRKCWWWWVVVFITEHWSVVTSGSAKFSGSVQPGASHQDSQGETEGQQWGLSTQWNATFLHRGEIHLALGGVSITTPTVWPQPFLQTYQGKEKHHSC